jgi:hypothetical protein
VAQEEQPLQQARLMSMELLDLMVESQPLEVSQPQQEDMAVRDQDRTALKPFPSALQSGDTSTSMAQQPMFQARLISTRAPQAPLCFTTLLASDTAVLEQLGLSIEQVQAAAAETAPQEQQVIVAWLVRVVLGTQGRLFSVGLLVMA